MKKFEVFMKFLEIFIKLLDEIIKLEENEKGYIETLIPETVRNNNEDETYIKLSNPENIQNINSDHKCPVGPLNILWARNFRDECKRICEELSRNFVQDCFSKPDPESTSDSNKNFENSNLSEGATESEHFVEAIPDSTEEWRKFVSELEEIIECKAELSDYLKEQIVCGNQRFYHVRFGIIIKYCEKDKSLPKSIREIEFYQYCKTEKNSIVYQSGDILICLKRVFKTSDIKYSKPELKGFVLDNPDERNKSGEAFYHKISSEEFNIYRRDYFVDTPSSVWHIEYEGCHVIINEIVRNQIFYTFLCVRFEGEIIPIKCWKWWFNFEYDRQKDPHQVPRLARKEKVEVKGDEVLQLFREFYKTCKLPNANKRSQEFLISSDRDE